MSRLRVGDRAPDFSIKAADGSTVSLGDFVGKRALVLFFYPKDHSPLCTKEACLFRDTYEKFIDAGAEVVGVSSDRTSVHRLFAQRNQLPFRLVTDAGGALRKAFGVPNFLGIFEGRTTFVIDKDGIVRLIYTAHFVADDHVAMAMAALE